MENDLSKIIEPEKNKIEEFIKSEEYKTPLTEREVELIMQVPDEDHELFKYVIKELADEGRIFITKRGRLTAPEKVGMYVGVLKTHKNGFGFVKCDGLEEDIYIAKENLGKAVHKDTVLVGEVRATGRHSCEGVIKKVIKRGYDTIVGTFIKNGKRQFVLPDEENLFRRIDISKGGSGGAATDDKVVVKITQPPNIKRVATGKVVEILGHKGEKGVDVLSIVTENGIPVEFPEKVREYVKNMIPDSTKGEDLTYREDFRNAEMVTIDGEDAKDLDDAVSCRVLENGNFELGVYIADVSHYVKKDSVLDREAYKRGTSVYLADRVIPMLPKELSNGICSLNEGVDRLCLCCIMEIDRRGNVVNHRIEKGIINVNRRMSYTIVNSLLTEENSPYIEEYGNLLPMFQCMKQLRDILFEKRRKRGAINFESREAYVVLNDEGRTVDILPRSRNVATSIIEEFMLAANETVAEEFFWLEAPFMYRSHQEPDDEKYDMLKKTVGGMGYVLRGDKAEPRNLQRLLESVKDKPEELFISTLALRSMQQARYTGECLGHYGLAAKYYCHFTSPIRRYPDLFIHRIISLYLDGMEIGELVAKFGHDLEEKAQTCSFNERRAEEAERQSVDMKKAEFMEDKVGQVFDGIISGVTGWGIYVELVNTCEGMVAYKNMNDDRYEFNRETMSCMGERTHKVYKPGDRVRVQLIRVSAETRQMDFVFFDGKA